MVLLYGRGSCCFVADHVMCWQGYCVLLNLPLQGYPRNTKSYWVFVSILLATIINDTVCFLLFVLHYSVSIAEEVVLCFCVYFISEIMICYLMAVLEEFENICSSKSNLCFVACLSMRVLIK